MNLFKFHELLVPSTLASCAISHAFLEESFVKIFCDPTVIHKNNEIYRPQKFEAICSGLQVTHSSIYV